jgi:hypothetical protein
MPSRLPATPLALGVFAMACITSLGASPISSGTSFSWPDPTCTTCRAVESNGNVEFNGAQITWDVSRFNDGTCEYTTYCKPKFRCGFDYTLSWFTGPNGSTVQGQGQGYLNNPDPTPDTPVGTGVDTGVVNVGANVSGGSSGSWAVPCGHLYTYTVTIGFSNAVDPWSLNVSAVCVMCTQVGD